MIIHYIMQPSREDFFLLLTDLHCQAIIEAERKIMITHCIQVKSHKRSENYEIC